MVGKAVQSQVVKVCWKIRKGALEVVRLAGGERGKSNYISNIITQRDNEWQGALSFLEHDGWTPATIRAICEAHPNPVPFSLNAKRAISKGPIELEKISETVARAFLVLAKEFAAGNEELRRRL
jgi:hypothetical protein